MSDQTASNDWILGRFDAKLEFITKLLEQSQEEHKVLRARVEALEARFWWAAGVAACVMFAGNFLLAKVGLR